MGKFNDCNSHLHVLSYVLGDHKGELGHRTPVEDTMSNKVKPKASRQIYIDRVGSDDEEEEFLKSQPLHLPESLSLHRHSNGCASPVAAMSNQRHEKVPKSWLHSVHCYCSQCQDLASHMLSLQLLAVKSDACMQQGQLKDAEMFAKILLRRHDNIAEKVQNILKILLAKHTLERNTVYVDIKEQAVLPSVFERVLLDGCILMAQLVALQSDIAAAKEWLERAHDLLDVRTRPRMVEAHTVLAQLQYQMALSSVPWPRHDEDVAETVVEKLCAQIGRITIANDRSDNCVDPGEFRTPLVTKLDTDMVQTSDRITQVKTSAFDEPVEVEGVDTREPAEADRKPAPTKKQGPTDQTTAARKCPVSIRGKSPSNISKVPSRSCSRTKILDVESPEVGIDEHSVDIHSSKAASRVPVRKTRAIRKCPDNRMDTVKNGDGNGALKAALKKAAEVDNRLCNRGSSVTETAYSTPTRSEALREGRGEVTGSDGSPIRAKSVFVKKTPGSVSSHRRKKYVFTDSDNDDEILKAPCGKPKRIARKGVPRGKATSANPRTSSRQLKMAVYIDNDGDANETLKTPSSRACRVRGRCMSQTAAKASTRRGRKNCPENDVCNEVKEEETGECAWNRTGPEPHETSEETVPSRDTRKGKVSKSVAKKFVTTETLQTSVEPARSLFKEVLTETIVARDVAVFDFDCSDGGKTPVREPQRKAATQRKGRLTLKKKSDRRKLDSGEIEMTRNAQEEEEPCPTYDSSEVVLPKGEGLSTAGQDETVSRNKRKPVRSSRAKQVVSPRTRVTRSKTGFVEELRQEIDEEDEDIGALIGFEEVLMVEANDSGILADRWHCEDTDETVDDQVIHENGKYRRSVTDHSIECRIVGMDIREIVDVETIEHVDDVALSTFDEMGVVATELNTDPVCLDDSIEIARFGSDSNTDHQPIRRKAGRRRNDRRTDTEKARMEQSVKLSPLDCQATCGDVNIAKQQGVTLPPCLPLTGESGCLWQVILLILVISGESWLSLASHPGCLWRVILVVSGGSCWLSLASHAGCLWWVMLVVSWESCWLSLVSHAGCLWRVMLVVSGGSCWLSLVSHAGCLW